MTLNPTTYAYLRRTGMRAIDAFRGAQSTEDTTWTDRAGDLDHPVRGAVWSQDGYQMTAKLDQDDYADVSDFGYGAFTNDTGPDTIPNDRAERHSYKRFRPDYSIAERTEDNRKRGMTRADARTAALEDARKDLIRALELVPAVLIVTASRAGIVLGTAVVGGIEGNADPAAPYGVAERFHRDYLAELLRDETTEAIAEAEERRPLIVAALAAES